MFTRTFWLKILENTIKVFASAAVSAIVAKSTDLVSTDWGNVFSVAGMAAVLYLLSALSTGVATNGTSTTFLGRPKLTRPRRPTQAAPVRGQVPPDGE